MALSWDSGEVTNPDSVQVRPGVCIRNRRRTRAWSAIAALWSVAFVALLVRSFNGHMTLVGDLVLGTMYLGLAALGVLLAYRVARAGLWIGSDGIVIRGPFKTNTLALNDASYFAPGLQGRGGNGTPCPILERRNGPAVGVWALGRRNIWFRYERVCQEIQPVCDELNQLVAALRGSAPST
jgi:hypothetical protein